MWDCSEKSILAKQINYSMFIFGVVEGDNTTIYLVRWIFGIVEGNVAIVKVMWLLIGPILDTYNIERFKKSILAKQINYSMFIEDLVTWSTILDCCHKGITFCPLFGYGK
jgi:hypothetical protein